MRMIHLEHISNTKTHIARIETHTGKLIIMATLIAEEAESRRENDMVIDSILHTWLQTDTPESAVDNLFARYVLVKKLTGLELSCKIYIESNLANIDKCITYKRVKL